MENSKTLFFPSDFGHFRFFGGSGFNFNFGGPGGPGGGFNFGGPGGPGGPHRQHRQQHGHPHHHRQRPHQQRVEDLYGELITNVEKLNEESFNRKVEGYNGDIWLIQFYSPSSMC